MSYTPTDKDLELLEKYSTASDEMTVEEKKVAIAKTWETPTGVNKPITKQQVIDWKKEHVGERGFITIAQGENRKTRRANTEDARPVINNRSKTKARKGNKLFLKMSAFYLSVTDKKLQAIAKRQKK